MTSTRPLRRDAALNRERVLAAAAEVFHEQGLAAGLDEIADRAGVGVGTVYRRFPDRSALLDALLTELLEVYLRVAQDALTTPDGGGLALFLREMGEVQASPRGCVLRLWRSPGTEELHEQVRQGLAALIADAQDRGACRRDVDVEDVVDVMIALRGIREAPHDGAVARDWRRHLELCLRGLRPDR